jgi:muramoyltetrapeptide carboxypeptidase
MAGLIKPRGLAPGSTIAIVAPAGPPDPGRLRKGLDFLRDHGYRTKAYPQVRRKLGYLAGDDKLRAQAIMDAFTDAEVDGILAARGGYGSLRILSYLDFDVIRSNPKVFVGYSDLTAILLSIYKKCAMVTFHGPMPAVEFGRKLKAYTAEHFFCTLEGHGFTGAVPRPEGYRYGSINSGAAEGPIIGGNLSLMARMVGTGFLPPFEGKIVFLEDTEEEPYRIDAYLAQLFSATDIKEASGFLIGEITRTESRFGHTKGWTAVQVIRDYFSRLDQPVIYNFPCGHGKEKITIPIGARVVLDTDRKSLEFKEAGVE